MSVERLEDLPLVTGRGHFAGDVSFPHQLHMRIVRSPSAHGHLKTIEVAAALQCPASSRFGQPTISPIYRLSIFAKDQMISLRHFGNRCWPRIMCAMLANLWLRCLQPILMWPKMRLIWSISRSMSLML